MTEILEFERFIHSDAPLRILLLGSQTQIGCEIRALVWPENFLVIAPEADELPLTDPGRIMAAIADGFRGDPWFAIINCAEYLSSAGRQGDQVLTWLTNTITPTAIGEACARSRIPFVNVITESIKPAFQSKLENIRATSSIECGLHASKIAGETAIKQTGARHITLRVSAFFSQHQDNFIHPLIQFIRSESVIYVPDTMINGLACGSSLAEAIVLITIRLGFDHECTLGTFNLFSNEPVSWQAVVKEVAFYVQNQSGRNAVIMPEDSSNPHADENILNLSSFRDALSLFHLDMPTWKQSLFKRLPSLQKAI